MKSPLQLCFCFTIIALLCLLGAAEAFTYSPMRSDEICGQYNGRKLYLDLGDKGSIKASFVNEEALLDSNSRASHSQCNLEIVTCPSCVITATFKYLNLSSCSQDSCRCDYVWITEPPYESSGAPFCGTSTGGSSSVAYRSLTRILNVAYLYSSVRKDAFEIEYRSERNKQVMGLSPPPSFLKPFLNLNVSRGGVLTSPFFPANYPRDLGIEYVITSMDQKSNVQVIFLDFQVSTSSIMEFYDWNGQRLDVTSGASFRPSIVISTGPSLLIRFYANGGSALGFKASYSFISNEVSKTPSVRPNMDCGGIVDNPGGAITMMHMAQEGYLKHYDCIWIVKPPRNYFHLKTHLYLKITQFAEFGGNTELVVRQGITSEGLPVENLRSPVSEMQPPSRALREMIIPVEVGFYIALRGTFSARSKLSIVYAAFSYMDCFAGADFLCKNHRCISSRLTCDGFDHCGDNSDEPTTTCMQDWNEQSLYDKRRHSNVPNYFFPKMDRYPDLRTATLVFLVSSLGLVLLIVALIVLLYKMGSRARQQRDLQNRLRTISELLGETCESETLSDSTRIEELIPDEPPIYEAPPGYDEIVKVASGQSLDAGVAGCSSRPDSEMRGGRARGRAKNKSRRRAKSTPGISSSAMENVGLRVALPRSRSPPSRRASTWSDDQGGSAPILMLASRNMGTTPIPDSPPPPYITDPSMAVNFSQDSLLARASRQTSSAEGAASSPLDAFADSFSAAEAALAPPPMSLTQELLGAESAFSDDISPSPTFNGMADEPRLAAPSPLPQSICKLASVEAFDELEASRESVAALQENFANFDSVDEYPACGSMTSYPSHVTSLDDVSRSTLDDVLSAHASRSHSRHPSHDLLDELQDCSGESSLTSWTAVPESAATVYQGPTINLSQQVELLKSQIVEQNAALARAEAEQRREREAAATSPTGRRRQYDADDPDCNLMVAKFIEVIQRRESNCSSSSDDSQSRQFF